MRRNSFVIALFLLFSLNSFAQENTEVQAAVDNVDNTRFFNTAHLQILNKTTAKTANLEIRVGTKTKFNNLEITARKCWQAPLDQRPESKILIDVSELKTGEDGKEEDDRIFYGWLFASSPSISGLEHPIYDIVAIDCKNK